MSRLIVPGSFCVGMVLCAGLLLVPGLWAAGPRDGVGDLRGTWDGFFLEADHGGVLGSVSSDITGQVDRNIEGLGMLLDLDGRPLSQTFGFGATVAADDVIAGTGRSAAGRAVSHGGLETFGLVFQGGLETFAGVMGDASVWDPDFLFLPVGGRPVRVSATLLHPFPDPNAPDIAGHAVGTARRLTQPASIGDIVLDISLRDRGSFPGSIHFVPNSKRDLPFSWRVRATTSEAGQFIMVGQGKTGRIAYVGSVIPSPKGRSPSAVWGIARLAFNDGQVLFNAINVSLEPVRR